MSTDDKLTDVDFRIAGIAARLLKGENFDAAVKSALGLIAEAHRQRREDERQVGMAERRAKDPSGTYSFDQIVKNTTRCLNQSQANRRFLEYLRKVVEEGGHRHFGDPKKGELATAYAKRKMSESEGKLFGGFAPELIREDYLTRFPKRKPKKDEELLWSQISGIKEVKKTNKADLKRRTRSEGTNKAP